MLLTLRCQWSHPSHATRSGSTGCEMPRTLTYRSRIEYPFPDWIPLHCFTGKENRKSAKSLRILATLNHRSFAYRNLNVFIHSNFFLKKSTSANRDKDTLLHFHRSASICKSAREHQFTEFEWYSGITHERLHLTQVSWNLYVEMLKTKPDSWTVHLKESWKQSAKLKST